MIKSVRPVFFVSSILFFFLILPVNSVLAEYLIRPIPDYNNNPINTNKYQSADYPINQSNDQSATDNRQLTTDNYIPSITFGHLLTYSPEEIEQIIKRKENEQENISKTKSKKVRELLTKLYLDSQKELAEFTNREFQTKDQPKSNSQNINPDPQATPYIPIPTLLAKIHSLVATPTPPVDPRIEKILAKARQPATDNIGDLEQNPKKNIYRIALLGDSMIDTLGKDLPHLRALLTSAFPDYSFVLFNYGQGGTDLESGLYRLTNPTSYLNTDFPPLLSNKIDILVLESFAYNHWSGQFYDLDRQWLTIAKIIETVKMHSPKTQIILAAAIAPNTRTFGDGKLNWPGQLKWDSATITKAYLQNIVNFATSEGYPLADAYHPSMDSSGNGLEKYINQSDHLHPSDEGARLFSEKIFEAIKVNNFIK